MVSHPSRRGRADAGSDFNFQATTDGSCQLVPGLSPPDHVEACADDPELTEFFEPTGYRRIPLTTCAGGRELEYVGQPRPCPGKEEEYRARHGVSGFALFLAITLPIAAAATAGFWVWKNWRRGMNKWGQIRLGEQSSGDGSWLRYPVMAISALVAVTLTLPSVAAAVWARVRTLLPARWSRGYDAVGLGRYTTRGSFGRDEDYAVVDEDEGELLGDESDEEV
jgi:hypothetical protein